MKWIPINGEADLPTAEEWERDYENFRYLAIDKECGDISEMVVHEDGRIGMSGYGGGMWEIPRHYAILTNFAWAKIPIYKEEVA